MIIDDHPMIRGTIASVLSVDPELKVVGESGDGEEGLNMVLADAPDIVLLDLDLPRLDGLTMIRRIRAKNRDVRILVLSAKPEQVMASHVRETGANGYVSKNREISELLIAIRTVLCGYECFSAGRSGMKPDEGIAALSARELEVLHYFARGASNKDVAARLCLSEKTVSTYKTRLQQKLGLRSLAALIEFATRHKLVD